MNRHRRCTRRGAVLCALGIATVLLSGAGPSAPTLRVDDWDTQPPGPLDLSAVWRPYPPSIAPVTFKHPPMIVLDAGRPALRLVTEAESVKIGRALSISLKELPMLVWEWKALILPAGGDVRRPDRNDQAARVMVLFEGLRSILYVWDTSAPVGAEVSSDDLEPFPRVLIVVRSGYEGVGAWHRERRDVYRDYERFYQEEPRRVKWIGLESHSDDVKGHSSVLLGQIGFEPRPPTRQP